MSCSNLRDDSPIETKPVTLISNKHCLFSLQISLATNSKLAFSNLIPSDINNGTYDKF